jgi:hypothetical protein
VTVARRAVRAVRAAPRGGGGALVRTAADAVVDGTAGFEDAGEEAGGAGADESEHATCAVIMMKGKEGILVVVNTCSVLFLYTLR